MSILTSTRVGCYHCFGDLDLRNSDPARPGIVQCTICGVYYHEECWHKLDHCPKCKNQVVVPVSGRLPEAPYPRAMTTQHAERQGCTFCFETLEPQDPRANLRTFVECDKCHAYFHAQCWDQMGRCVCCQGRLSLPVLMHSPGPLPYVQTRRPLLPPNPLGSAADNNRWVLLISLAAIGAFLTIALGLCMCLVLVLANQSPLVR